MSPATIQLKTLIRDVETEYSGNRGYFGYDGNSGYLGSYGTKGGLSSGNSGYNGYYGYGGNNDYFGSSYRPYDTEEYALYDVTSAPIVVMAQEDATLAQLAQEIEGRVVSLLSSRGDAETALREWMGQCDALEGEMKRLQGEELRRLGEAAKRREEDRWGNREGHRVGSAWEPQGVTQGVEKEGNDTPPVLSSETPSEMEETPQGTPQDTPQGVYRGLLGGDASTAVDPLGEVWGRAPHLPLLRALQGDWRRSLVSCDQRRVLEAIPAGSQVWLLVGAVAVEARAPSRRYYATPMAQESAAAQAWLGEVREKGAVALAVARERWGRGAATSLRECFEVFGRQGDLDEGNKWFCPRCGRHVVARSVTRVDRLPSVLVLQLERFEYAQPLYGGEGGDDGDGDGDGDGVGVGDGVHNDDVNAIDAIYNGAELQRLQSLSWLPYADKVGERGWYDGGVDAAAVHSGRSRRARAESADLRAVSAPAAGSEQVGMSGEMEGRVLRNPEDDHYLRSGVTAEMTSELVMRFFVCGVCWRIQEGIVDAGVIC